MHKGESTKRTFLLLTLSQVFSKLANRALLIGLSWYLVSQYSQHALFLYLTLTMTPHLIMTFFSGRLINRYSPIFVVRSCELLRSLVILALGIMAFSSPHHISLMVIIVLCTGANFCAAVFNPALLTLPRQLLLDSKGIQKITGLLTSSASTARMVGPMIALPVFSYAGISGLILLCFLLYLIAWAILLLVKTPMYEMTENLVDGKERYIIYLTQLFQENRLVFVVLALFFLINLAVVPIQLFMPLVVKVGFQMSMHLLTFFEASLGCGLLLGGLIVVVKPFKVQMRYRIFMPYFFAALSYLCFAESSGLSVPLSIAALFFFGLFLAVGNITTLSFYQQYSKQRHIAQIMALGNLVSNASALLAMAVASGFLAIGTPLKSTLIGYALSFVVLAMLLFLVRGLKRVPV